MSSERKRASQEQRQSYQQIQLLKERAAFRKRHSVEDVFGYIQAWAQFWIASDQASGYQSPPEDEVLKEAAGRMQVTVESAEALQRLADFQRRQLFQQRVIGGDQLLSGAFRDLSKKEGDEGGGNLEELRGALSQHLDSPEQSRGVLELLDTGYRHFCNTGGQRINQLLLGSNWMTYERQLGQFLKGRTKEWLYLPVNGSVARVMAERQAGVPVSLVGDEGLLSEYQSEIDRVLSPSWNWWNQGGRYQITRGLVGPGQWLLVEGSRRSTTTSIEPDLFGTYVFR
jgi:hypothetical protein